MKPIARLLDRVAGAFKTPAAPPPVDVLEAAPIDTPSAETVPLREVEGRREFHGLLWFPVFTVKDDEKLVVAAKAGLPHCLRCERALALGGAREEWACATCGERRPGSEVDFFVADSVIAGGLKEFFEGHPGFRPSPSLSAPQRCLAV
jgi:hypothetical protein